MYISCRYVLWADGEPSFSNHRKCVAIDSFTGYWKTVVCKGLKLKRLCKRLLGNLLLRLHVFKYSVLCCCLVDFSNGVRQHKAPSQPQCSKSELYFNDACYYFSEDEDTPESLTLADEKCRSRGAQLASISSIHENAFIAKETSVMTRPMYWIGLVYNSTSSAFKWRHGQAVTFTRWAKYEPTYEKGECVAFGFDGRDFTWSVLNCTTKARYVCKSKFVGSIWGFCDCVFF